MYWDRKYGNVIEVHEDIFESPAQTLTVPINAVGAMGKGLAQDFREKVPGLYTAYQQRCQENQFVQPEGRLWVFPWHQRHKQVLCFPTKIHWRDYSSLDLIVRNLRELVSNYRELGITSLAIPPVGCGLGGLSYEFEVRDALFEILSDLPFEVRITYGMREPQ